MGGDQKLLSAPDSVKKEAHKLSQENPLTPLECVQVSIVLRAALEQLSLVGLLTVDPVQQAQELAEGVGEEVLRIIEHQKELEQQFGELVTAQPALRVLPNKSRLQENQRQLEQVSAALRECTRSLCRNLKDSPNVAENLAKVTGERAALQDLLARCAAVVQRKSNVLPAIEHVLTVEHNERQVKETLENERRTSEEVKKLRATIRSEAQQHDVDVRATNEKLRNLKEELRKEKLSAAISTRYNERDLKAGNEHERRLHKQQLEDLATQLSRLQLQLKLEQQAHMATCEFLQKQCGGLIERADDWSHKVGKDGHQRDRELETVRVQHVRDQQRLDELQRQLDAERTAKEERTRQAAEAVEALEQAAQEEVRKVRAAMRIQAAWRGYKVRSAAKGGAKKKGGKAAKGGKKKKK